MTNTEALNVQNKVPQTDTDRSNLNIIFILYVYKTELIYILNGDSYLEKIILCRMFIINTN